MTDRWKRLTPPLAGVVLVALVVVGLFMSDTPNAGDSGTKVLAYYNSHQGRTGAALILFGYAGVMSVIFYSGVATYLRRRGAELTATLTIAGGVLFGASLCLGAGTAAVLIDHTDRLSPDAAQALNSVSEDLFWVMMIAGLMIATVSMGIGMLQTKSMPKALGIVTLVVGAVAASGIGGWFAFMGSGPLILVIAGYLYQRTGQPEEIVLPEVPGQRAAEPAAPVRRSRAKAE
jgi:FtsH-binding integral membrane protein